MNLIIFFSLGNLEEFMKKQENKQDVTVKGLLFLQRHDIIRKGLNKNKNISDKKEGNYNNTKTE